ncbi:MAG: DUF411 domain-containing protein [Xanthobacteraceae bacterium]|nr:MAG: DUF411 domain-containing protein [Xanthobacteraceae bacterium]
MPVISRRSLMAAAAASAFIRPLAAQTLPPMVIHKDPNCGCCSAWDRHLRAAGFDTRVIETAEMDAVKTRLGVPAQLTSCHTAEIDGYVIEGHVPAATIRRLLSGRPAATGLAVAGMPIGSPGMAVPGEPDEIYDVVLFGPAGHKTYARFKGAQELLARS